ADPEHGPPEVPALLRRHGPGRPSPSPTRASTVSGCGLTCCSRPRWRSTSSVTSPPTSGSPDRAVRTWWPDAPGTVREVRFAHSPGRCDPAKLSHLPRFLQVDETSGAFRAGAFDAVR